MYDAEQKSGSRTFQNGKLTQPITVLKSKSWISKLRIRLYNSLVLDCIV